MIQNLITLFKAFGLVISWCKIKKKKKHSHGLGFVDLFGFKIFCFI